MWQHLATIECASLRWIQAIFSDAPCSRNFDRSFNKKTKMYQVTKWSKLWVINIIKSIIYIFINAAVGTFQRPQLGWQAFCKDTRNNIFALRLSTPKSKLLPVRGNTSLHASFILFDRVQSKIKETMYAEKYLLQRKQKNLISMGG